MMTNIGHDSEGVEVEIPDFNMTPLFERICWAHSKLGKQDTDYRCVYEDPAKPDEPAVIMCPSGRWMAMAKAGGMLPPINAYLDMPMELELEDGKKIECTKSESEEIRLKHNVKSERVLKHHKLHTSKPIGPLNEEEALEYLVMKDVPRRVWDSEMKGYKTNWQKFFLCKTKDLPPSRKYRNAWRINRELVT